MSRPRFFPVVLAGAAAFLDIYATQPILPLLMRLFGGSHFAVSLTVTAPTLAVALAAPVIGRVADLVGRKRVIVGSAIGLTVVTALSATATSLPQFIAWRFIQGLLTPGIFAITIAYIQDEFSAPQAARASGAYVAGTVSGGFVGRTLVGLVAAQAGWRVSFVTLALVNLATAVGLALWLPADTARAWRTGRAGHGKSAWRLLKDRQLMATNVVGFCVLFSLVGMFTNVTFYLSEAPFLLSTGALAWLFVVYLVGAGVVPITGRTIGKLGYRWTHVSGMACSAMGALLTLVPSLGAVVVGLALVGTGVFIAQATASSYIGVVTANDRGLAVGLYSTAYYLGGTLGGTLPSLFWSRGGWPACVALVLGVQVVSVVMALKFWKVDRPLV